MNTQSYRTRYSCFKIGNQSIKYNPNPVILGTTFDESLCFSEQVEYIREKCFKRLSLIKILAGKSWKISKKFLLSLYKSLIGSVIDYSSFILNVISDTNLDKLKAIQNKAVRIIYKLPYDTSTDDLCRVANLSLIEERLHTLNSTSLMNVCLVLTMSVLFFN